MPERPKKLTRLQAKLAVPVETHRRLEEEAAKKYGDKDALNKLIVDILNAHAEPPTRRTGRSRIPDF